MTVCIAATCNDGERIMTATDGLLSLGDVTGDSVPGKMLWYGDWQFMYAGNPATFALIVEEIEGLVSATDPDALLRQNVQETVRQAYRKVYSRSASFDSLSPFDMTMEQFKESGLACFGAAFHEELLRRISNKASLIYDQILVTGWGQSPHSVMIYEVGPGGDWLHTTTGFAAIGSGSQMAQTMLVLLGQARHHTLAETIFNVACSKFYSEKSSGLDVGEKTTIYVSRKRRESDEQKKPCGEFVCSEDLDKLRDLWNSHLKPRIPDEARIEITGIAARVNKGRITAHDTVELLGAQQRLREKHSPASSEDPPNPQSTTADPSSPLPSPE